MAEFTTRFYISSGCSNRECVFEAIDELSAVGFKRIELTGGTSHRYYDAARLLTTMQQLELDCIVHNYFPPPAKPFILNIATDDSADGERCLDLVKQAVDLSVRCGKGYYGLHAGYDTEMLCKRDAKGIFEGVRAIQNAEGNRDAFLTALLPYLPPGFTIGLENAFPHHDDQSVALLHSPDRIMDFVERFANTPYGLLLDLGHLEVCSRKLGFDKLAFLERLLPRWSDRIFEIHLSAPDGVVDAHGINHVNEPVVVFLKEHKKLWWGMPFTCEWQGVDVNHAFAAYEELVSFLTA